MWSELHSVSLLTFCCTRWIAICVELKKIRGYKQQAGFPLTHSSVPLKTIHTKILLKKWKGTSSKRLQCFYELGLLVTVHRNPANRMDTIYFPLIRLTLVSGSAIGNSKTLAVSACDIRRMVLLSRRHSFSPQNRKFLCNETDLHLAKKTLCLQN